MKKIIFLTAVLLLVVACGPKIILLSEKTYPPTTELVILTEYPTGKLFDKIAILTITDEGHFSTKGMMKALKQKAKSLGANAIVLENVGQGQSGALYGTTISGKGFVVSGTSGIVYVTATAIRYK